MSPISFIWFLQFKCFCLVIEQYLIFKIFVTCNLSFSSYVSKIMFNIEVLVWILVLSYCSHIFFSI